MSNPEQLEELDVLQAIYGEDVEVDGDAGTVQVYLPCRSHIPCVILRVLLVPGYPASDPPVVELHAPHVSEDSVSQACSALENMFTPGEVIIHTWVQHLIDEASHLYETHTSARHIDNTSHQAGSTHQRQRGQQADQHHWTSDLLRDHDDDDDDEDDEDWQASEEDEDDDSHEDDEEEGAEQGETWREGQRKVSNDIPKMDGVNDAPLMSAVRSRIISGDPVTEKKSTFQAHVAHVTSVAEVHAVVQVLLESNKIRNATHNMMAYRISHMDAPGVFHQDCDDDGEAAAGGRLMHLLQVADARDVVVVVSRWFGGVLLGPSRFTVINNTARALLEKQGIIKAGKTGSGLQGQSPQTRKGNTKRKGRADKH